MSLDKLAVIFIIIILPIAIVLGVYTDAQTQTLKMQLEYDKILDAATSDAIKTYQINSFNDTTSHIGGERMREINAAANSFFTSLATSLDMQGYNKESLQDYVPALVFTMYDGYYMYSKYINNLTDNDSLSQADIDANPVEYQGKIPSTYQNGDMLYGVKPFVSYSCKYKNYPVSGDDFVISYTLDNYITIQGVVNGEYVNESGYVIDINQLTVRALNKYVQYKNIDFFNSTDKGIPEKILEENVGNNKYKYHKINGTKWYYDDNLADGYDGENYDEQWFYLLNGHRIYDNSKKNIDKLSTTEEDAAYQYFADASVFTHHLIDKYNLGNLKPMDAYEVIINKDGNTIKYNNGEFLNQVDKDKPIFELNNIDEPTSNFNKHRLAVIRYTIEKNLSIAIKNYNHYSPTVEADFQMPELKETEWDKIMNNMTIISFLQGMPIGTKIYNGCSVVANNKNDEVVNEESIVIANMDNNEYYRPTYRGFQLNDNLLGINNVDLERKSIDDDNSVNLSYYYPKWYFANYDSISNPAKNANIYSTITDGDYNFECDGNIYKYFRESATNNNELYNKIAKKYYVAIAREKYSKYTPKTIDNYNDKYKNELLGDINGDGNITVDDAIKLAQSLLSFINGNVDDKKIYIADVNKDGNVNNEDVIIIQRHAAGFANY